MSLRVHPSHSALQIRKLMLQKHVNGASTSELASTYDLRIKTIKHYIDRHFYTGSVSSDYEMKKKLGQHKGERIFDNEMLSDYVNDQCVC